MARRGRGSSPTRSSFGPARAPARAAPPTRAAPPAPAPSRKAPVPAAAPPTAVGAPMPSQGPGLMGQMAATAGGVAIGSVVGHALTGVFSGGSNSEPATAQQQQPQEYQQQQASQQNGPCAFELKQFLDCSQSYDLSLCEGFNEALKQCRLQQPGAPMNSNW